MESPLNHFGVICHQSQNHFPELGIEKGDKDIEREREKERECEREREVKIEVEQNMVRRGRIGYSIT